MRQNPNTILRYQTFTSSKTLEPKTWLQCFPTKHWISLRTKYTTEYIGSSDKRTKNLDDEKGPWGFPMGTRSNRNTRKDYKRIPSENHRSDSSTNYCHFWNSLYIVEEGLNSGRKNNITKNPNNIGRNLMSSKRISISTNRPGRTDGIKIQHFHYRCKTTGQIFEQKRINGKYIYVPNKQRHVQQCTRRRFYAKSTNERIKFRSEYGEADW